MSCLMLFLLAIVIMYFGALIAFFLAVGMVPLALLALVLIPLALLFTWRIIYPWLVRMGRWSAQLGNIVFLAFVLVVLGVGLGYVFGAPTIQLPLIGITAPVTVVLFGLFFFFLLLLAVAVWLVRLWRYLWPILKNATWDICCRIAALLWLIVAGILLGIGEIFHHPPLRWVVATVLFYFRKIAAAVAWLLYNPPLREIIRAGLLIARVLVLPLAWLLFHPPIIWLVRAMIFVLRLVVRIISGILYAILSLPMRLVNGARDVLKRGLTVERESYQDYNHAHYDSSATA